MLSYFNSVGKLGSTGDNLMVGEFSLLGMWWGYPTINCVSGLSDGSCKCDLLQCTYKCEVQFSLFILIVFFFFFCLRVFVHGVFDWNVQLVLGFVSFWKYTRYMWVNFCPFKVSCGDVVKWCYHFCTGISFTPPFPGESIHKESLPLEKKTV